MDDAIYDKATGLLVEYRIEEVSKPNYLKNNSTLVDSILNGYIKPKREIKIELPLETEHEIRMKIFADSDQDDDRAQAVDIKMYGRPFVAMLIDNQVMMFAQDGQLPHVIVIE